VGSRGQTAEYRQGQAFIELSDQAKCCAPNAPPKAILYDWHAYLKAVQAIAPQAAVQHTSEQSGRQWGYARRLIVAHCSHTSETIYQSALRTRTGLVRVLSGRYKPLPPERLSVSTNLPEST